MNMHSKIASVVLYIKIRHFKDVLRTPIKCPKDIGCTFQKGPLYMSMELNIFIIIIIIIIIIILFNFKDNKLYNPFLHLRLILCMLYMYIYRVSR